MLKNIFNGAKIISLVMAGVLLASLLEHAFLNSYNASGWVINADEGLESLPPFEKAVLGEMVINKSVFSASDVLGNFTSYYHLLISILLTIIALLAGFITLNFYQSQEEHDNLLKSRLNDLIKNFDKSIDDETARDHLDKYAALHDYIERRILHVMDNSDDIQEYISWATSSISPEMLDQAIISKLDDEILAKLCERVECENGTQLVIKETTEGENGAG